MFSAQKHGIGSSHFSAKTLRALTRKGIRIIGITTLPGADGSYTSGATGYQLDDNGTHRIRGFIAVREIASGVRACDEEVRS